MEIVCPARHPAVERLVDAVPALAAEGVTAIEITLQDPAYFDRTDPAEVQSLLDALSGFGVRAHSIHAPFGEGYDISSLNDEVHERGVDALIDSVELAALLGAEKVIVHASHKATARSNSRFERARGVLREVSVIAREAGIMLALENLPPDYIGHSPEEILNLIDGCDRQAVGVCFDTGHANLSGSFTCFARRLLPHTVAVHIHDNDGTEDTHRFPGQGSIDWAGFWQSLQASRCTASIMLECPPPDNIPWKAAFQKLRALFES